MVTGGGAGIGRAVAVRLARGGSGVGVIDLDAITAEETVARICGEGGRAMALPVDVTNAVGVEDAVVEVVERYGPLTKVANVAGTSIRKDLLSMSLDEWNHVIGVNLTGYFLVLKSALPRMRRAGGGAIVQIASIAGHIGYGSSAYTASKGGILALTKQLARELARDGIRINSVSPGIVRTEINRMLLDDPKVAGQTIANTPLGRIGEPDDIAAAVEFLLGPDSGFITGADLLVDGGMISYVHRDGASPPVESA